MISEKMIDYVRNSSAIRAMFEEGKKLAAQYGKENVYDFSLGNPSVTPPKAIKEAMLSITQEEDENYLHGYMNNSGYEDVRTIISESLNRRFYTDFNQNNIIMTVGAAGGLNVILKTLLNPGDEVITFAPFFGEYRSYVANYDGNLIVISPDTTNFMPKLDELEVKVTGKTKAVIINTPNNPTGVVYTEEVIQKMSAILEGKQKEFGNPIYLISDEPYRELIYEDMVVPYVPNYYKNTIVGYSFSKSLSLPGERIGYLVIPTEADGYEDLIAAANVANRILGFVNAPSFMQRVVAACIDIKIDVEPYNKNRELLYESLSKYGYTCIKPQGAFYLFIKALEENDVAFVETAKKYNLLMVPGSSFGCPGYCRIAYCVEYNTIENSLNAFKKLADEYQVQ